MEVPVFRPTLEEAQGSWEAYMNKIEPHYEQVTRLAQPNFKCEFIRSEITRYL